MKLNKNTLKQEVIEKIRGQQTPVIIFGAGIVGEVVYDACRRAGIEVESFCDNNSIKIKYPKCNLEVIHTPGLRNRYKDAIFIISAADIRDSINQLNELGYNNWYPCSLLLRDYDISESQFSTANDFVEFTVSTCLLCQDSYLNPDKLFLRSVDIIITERCSLKCRDCSNLMQYYKKPQDCRLDEIMKSIDAMCSVIDEINEVRVIGGEPFMNKEIHLVIEKLNDEPKVRKIVIYTNGTIIPKPHQIEYLKNNKVLFIITDYGYLSKNLHELTRILRQNNIAFFTLKVQGWSDCSKIERHYRGSEEQKVVFNTCCAKNLITLSDGKLYRCPYAANASRLQAVPDNENDYIDLYSQTLQSGDITETRNKIRHFLLGKEYLEACDYCNGRPYDASLEIQPAIQTKIPLVYG